LLTALENSYKTKFFGDIHTGSRKKLNHHKGPRQEESERQRRDDRVDEEHKGQAQSSQPEVPLSKLRCRWVKDFEV
jgi:hypothetical protein